MKAIYAFVFIWILGFSFAKGYDGIVISNSDQIIDISDKIRYGEFHPEEYDSIDFDFTENDNILYKQVQNKKSIVAYFNLINNLDEDLYLQISNPSLDKLILVRQDGKNEEVIYRGGLHYKGYVDNIRLSKYLLDLGSKKGSQLSYALIVIDDKPLDNFTINIGTLKKYLDDKPGIYLLEGIFLGIFLLLVFYSLFQYFSIKDYSYIYFGFYSASLLLLFAVFKGYTIEYFLGKITHFYIYVKLLVCASGIIGVLFTTEFLKTIVNTPRRHMWLLSFVIFYIISAIMLLYGGGKSVDLLIYYNTIATIGFIIYVSFSRNKKGFKPALFYLIAWAILYSGILLTVLREQEIISYNLFTEHILQISILLHIITLSFALANKVKIYIDKKNEAQEIALKTAIENEKLITHQKQVLETKVFERTKDLEQSIAALKKQEEELKEANLFKDKVFSVISHDLKSPVSSLTGMLELLKLNTLSKEEKMKIIENLDFALKNTKYLLENILVWANPKLGNGSQISKFQLYSIVDEIFQLFSIQAKAKKIELISYISPDVKIKTEKNVLRLVLRNLISNALKFTSSGGKIEMNVEMAASDIIISVKDNGIGISESDRNRLFESNRHYSTRGTENEKGTGLGLILCKEFLEKNNGRIWVESQPGKGSTFYIALHNVLEKKYEWLAV